MRLTVTWSHPKEPLFPIVALALAVTGAARAEPAASGPPVETAPAVVSLNVYFHAGNGDYFSASTDASAALARKAGYVPVGPDGYVFATELPGTVPLKLFFHKERGDYFTTPSDVGEKDALSSGYELVGTEGWVYPTPMPQSAPLRLLWHEERKDTLLATGEALEKQALADGYVGIRVEGHAFATPEAAAHPLRLYWSPTRSDSFTAASPLSEADAKCCDYVPIRTEGAAFPAERTGTVPLKLFWSEAREDTALAATAASEKDLTAAGYTLVRVDAHVFPEPAQGLVPLQLMHHPKRQDYLTVASAQAWQDAIHDGYTAIRTEGFVLPATREDRGDYVVSVRRIVARAPTKDDPTSWDGRGDELFYIADMAVVDRQAATATDLGQVKSPVLGDRWRHRERFAAGSASREGGFKQGDVFPPSEAEDKGPGGADQPFLELWRGTLTAGKDMVLIVPTLWEDDGGGPLQRQLSEWAGRQMAKIGAASGKMAVPSALAVSAKELGVAGPALSLVAADVSANRIDRPLGLKSNGRDGYVFEPTFIVLTQEAVHRALASVDNGGNSGGRILLTFKDEEMYEMELEVRQLR